MRCYFPPSLRHPHQNVARVCVCARFAACTLFSMMLGSSSGDASAEESKGLAVAGARMSMTGTDEVGRIPYLELSLAASFGWHSGLLMRRRLRCRLRDWWYRWLLLWTWRSTVSFSGDGGALSV